MEIRFFLKFIHFGIFSHCFFIRSSDLASLLQGFADVALMRVLCEKVSALMERDWADRSEDDKLLIERILIVIRNILHISQDVSNEKVSLPLKYSIQLITYEQKICSLRSPLALLDVGHRSERA